MSINGEAQVVKLPAIEVNQHAAAEHVVERMLYRWSPPSDLIPKLPAGYSVALESWRFRDGVRRFTPANPRQTDFNRYTFYDATAFAFETSAGGRALLWYRGEKDPCPWFTYEPARLFVQYAQHLREHLGPTRKLGDALNLCRGARRSPGETDVLPADIGLDNKGNGERWTVGRLKAEGLQAAREREIESPTEDDIARLGLLAAAEANPLQISDAESEFITRSVLFRINSDLPEPSDDLLTFVATHVGNSIKKNQDVSDEKFCKWIEDRHSNLIRSIQRASGDVIKRDQIRAALLELAWRSVKMLGKSVDTQMRVFREALPQGLTSAEDFLYEQSYLANPMFGGLPLILLHDRMSFLNEVIPDFWTQPSDRRQIQKVRTMLYYYGIIVGNLRDGGPFTSGVPIHGW